LDDARGFQRAGDVGIDKNPCKTKRHINHSVDGDMGISGIGGPTVVDTDPYLISGDAADAGDEEMAQNTGEGEIQQRRLQQDIDGPDGDGDGQPHNEARQPKTIKSPYQPSKREIDEHNITHMPYRSWCPHCVK